MKWLIRIGVVLLLLVALAWPMRNRLLLEAVGIAVRLRDEIGPQREVVWAAGPSTPAQPADRRPPNIVLILADDLGWNDLSFGGGGVAGGTVPTPSIDRIAAEGAQFTRGYAASGTCAPSRAAIMSGRYPTRFGFEFTPTPPQMMPLIVRLVDPDALHKPITRFDEVGSQGLPFEEMGMPASEVTLAEILKQAGYRTGHIGKWHLGRSNGMAPEQQGFDESLLMASGLYLPEDDPDVVNSKQEFDPIDQFLWKGMRHAAAWNGGPWFEPGGYITDYYTDEAVKFIEANRNRPFFLYLAHWAPHSPLQALKRDYDALSHIADHRERVYAAMILALDRSVGRVLDALDENRLTRNTLVLFTSDNGGAGYIGLPEINQPFRGWKMTYFEGGIHVPFFARWPLQIPSGRSYDEPVHHFDLFATAAAAAGAKLPEDRTIDGVDLLPFARGIDGGPAHDRLFWRGGQYRAVVADGWKYQETERPEAQWLSDMRADPTERNNLAASRPERVAAMRALLAAHSEEQAPPAWPSLLEAPVTIDKTSKDIVMPDDEYIYWPN